MGDSGSHAPGSTPEGRHGGKRRSRLGLRRKLAAFPADGLQLLALLIAFVLLLAAKDFAARRPVLTAVLVFIFSLPYLAASVATQRAHFLYATMLLGAASYFLTCYGLGAPATAFPLLSVPLVFALWGVGRYLRARLPDDLRAFPRTVFRAMNVTVAVFAVWAAVQAPDLLGAGGRLSYAIGLTYAGYGALYLLHALGGGPVFYAYVFAFFAGSGGALLGAAALPTAWVWPPVLAAGAIALLAGTGRHAESGYRWSRHFYYAGAVAVLAALGFSALSLAGFLTALAAAGLLLHAVYLSMAAAVGDVRGATTAERVTARCCLHGSFVLAVPLVPLLMIVPFDPRVFVPALAFGGLAAWVAFERRRALFDRRNPYVPGATFFLSVALLAPAVHLPRWVGIAWWLALPPLMVAGLSLLRASADGEEQGPTRRALAEATALPAFFAWFVPLVSGHPIVALGAAVLALGAAGVAGAVGGDKRLFYGLGPALAGAVIAAVLCGGEADFTMWSVAGLAAAVCATVAVRLHGTERGLAGRIAALAWFILSAGVVAIAVATGRVVEVLFAATAVGFIAALTAGRLRGHEEESPARRPALLLAGLATAAALVLGPFTGLTPMVAGFCLLALAAAYGWAWGGCRVAGYAHAGQGLFALGVLLVIFGGIAAPAARLAAGLAAVVPLFALGVWLLERHPKAAEGAVTVGHGTSLALAGAALLLSWPTADWRLAAATLPFIALYALMPRLRGRTGFRLGTAGWTSLLVLFALSAGRASGYPELLPFLAALSMAWVALGYALQRAGRTGWSGPLYICAASLAIMCGAVSLLAPSGGSLWPVFLANGLVFASLFLVLRQDIFAYLLTLALCLTMFDWVRASTSPFTQDVLFYLVIGAGVLGVFFLLPYLKRLVVRMGSLPMVGIFTWRGATFAALPVLGVAVLVLSAYSVKLTEHPRFCTSCHYMGNYYESWQHSSHKDVACVKCHYEPGVQAEVEGKMAGMVQLVKYVTHSYGTRPHAQISNKSCMRPGCHAEMNQSHETLLFRGSIRFRHDEHLAERPRGKKLNCVSCHGQVVEGQHISVSETTCLTCHFYGREDRPVAVGQCKTCHVVPEELVTFAGQDFSHRGFLADNQQVKCTHCHSAVTEGQGRISSTRCTSCHLQRYDRVEDQAEFHLIHVSEGHFDCLQCHNEIKHGVHPMPKQLMTTSKCDTCHSNDHSIQERVYAGTALPGMQVKPDAMYRAGVACDGCHLDMRFVQLGQMTVATNTSGGKQCADCHKNRAYADLLKTWQQNVKDRLAELQQRTARLQREWRTAQPDRETRELLESARMKLAVVERDGSHGAHNISYVLRVLDEAEQELERCRARTEGVEQTEREVSMR